MSSYDEAVNAGADDPADDEVAAFAGRMFDLARAGDVALLDLVDGGVPVDLANGSGDSLLMLAAYSGHAGIVRGLAVRGADADLANDRGQTPLAGAVFKGHDDVIEALVAAGADIDAGTPSARETARMFGRELPGV